jgi:hypothetical protein
VKYRIAGATLIALEFVPGIDRLVFVPIPNRVAPVAEGRDATGPGATSTSRWRSR